MKSRSTGSKRRKQSSVLPRSPKHGEILTAVDVKERLVQDVSGATLLLWPPNLFAFTSYTLMLSGAYQLVVSPPPGERERYHWPPTRALLDKLLDCLIEGRTQRNSVVTLAQGLRADFDFAEYVLRYIDRGPKSERYNIWTYLVRKTALEWRSRFEKMTKAKWNRYSKGIPVALKTNQELRAARARTSVPP